MAPHLPWLAVLLTEQPAQACAPQTAYAYNTYTPDRVMTVAHGSAYCGVNPNESECADSVVYLPGDDDGIVDPSNPYLNDALFVFLPGTNNVPDDHKKLLRMAAFAGFRTIGLSYYNPNEVDVQCSVEGHLECEPNYFDECAYEVRWERLSGFSDSDTTHAVPAGASIAYRLVEVLEALVAWDLDDSVDDWHFDDYCVGGCSLSSGSVPWTDAIEWDRVVIGGFSQGAGYAQLLSLLQEVDGIVCIDGGNDGCLHNNNERVSSYLPDLVDLWGQDGGASPDNGEFAAIHHDHEFLGMASPEIVPDTFEYVQLHGDVHEIDTEVLPLTQNVVRTDQNWPSGCGAHDSMAKGPCMPTEATWDEANSSNVHSSTFPPDLHVFPSYVEGFCNARAL